MWVALGITLTVMLFLCAYGAMTILSTIALITKGRTTMPRKTIAQLEAQIAALQQAEVNLGAENRKLRDSNARLGAENDTLMRQSAAKSERIVELEAQLGKTARRANHAEAAPREPQPITAAKLELKGETITATVKRGGADSVLASTHQKYVAGLVARILAGGCPADAIIRVGF